MILSLQPRIRGMVLDMDGVLWRGSRPIGDLPAIFACLAEFGIRVVLATNNSTNSVDQYIDRLSSFGLHLEAWQIVNSGQASAHLLRQKFPQGGRVFIVGEQGLVYSLEAAGFTHSENGALAVVAGLDRKFTYEKLTKASDLIRAGVPFIGTNPDATFPSPHGITPGAGSILAAIQVASGTTPEIAGKPERAMFDVALERLGTSLEETITIGDRLDTDIAGGQRIGLRTGLVLSGVTTQQEADTWLPRPDLIARNLSEMLSLES